MQSLVQDRKLFKHAGFDYCKQCKQWTKPAHNHIGESL